VSSFISGALEPGWGLFKHYVLKMILIHIWSLPFRSTLCREQILTYVVLHLPPTAQCYTLLTFSRPRKTLLCLETATAQCGQITFKWLLYLSQLFFP